MRKDLIGEMFSDSFDVNSTALEPSSLKLGNIIAALSHVGKWKK